MAGNPVTSFFTKLRRPETRDKSRERNVSKERNVPKENVAKKSDEGTRAEQKVQKRQRLKSDSEATVKNENTKRKVKAERRKSSAMSYLLCMSKNGDTLERAPHAARPEKAKDNKNIKQQNKGNKKEGLSEKVENGNNKTTDGSSNLAPRKGWFSPVGVLPPELLVSKSQGVKENSYGPMYQPARGPSQGVRYRVDGTLEKPYVFPSGFTFGPEGRKVQLRRSTPDYHNNLDKNSVKVKAEKVAVDVHAPSPVTEEFDAKKAFYLKFDALVHQANQRNLYRHSMPEVPQSFNAYTDMDTGPKNDSAKSLNTKPPARDETIPEMSGGVRESWRDKRKREGEGKVRRSQRKNRYSMPVKNDEYVYMGSFENVNLCDSLDKRVNRGREEAEEEERSKKVESHRYSMPQKNPDLVYMGSLEDLNKHGVGNDASDSPREFNKDDASRWSNASIQNYIRAPAYKNGSSREKLPEDGRTSGPRKLSGGDTNVGTSMTSLTANVKNAKLEDEEEDDFFDEDFSMSRTAGNPFSRAGARSSYMPDNKRFMAPPPVACVSKPNNATVASLSPSNGMKTTVAGGKLFNIPPPPTYTPPWEEMESVQGRLSEFAGCHKGSQVDISFDGQSLTMEERDMSLNRISAKTLQSAVTRDQSPDPKQRPQDSATQAAVSRCVIPSPQPVTIPGHIGTAGRLENNNPAAQRSTTPGQVKLFNASPQPQEMNQVKPLNGLPKPQEVNSDYEYIYLAGSSPQVLNKPIRVSNTDSGLRHESTDSTTTVEPPQPENSTLRTVVTSTPKSVRRPKSDAGTTGDRPVPSPRKRFSGVVLSDSSISNDTFFTLVDITDIHETQPKTSPPDDITDIHETQPKTSPPDDITDIHETQPKKSPPVPRKRQTVSQSSPEVKEIPEPKPVPKLKPDATTNCYAVTELLVGPTCQLSSTSNPYKTVDIVAERRTPSTHIYEDVEKKSNTPVNNSSPSRARHYEACGSLTKEGVKEDQYFFIELEKPTPRSAEVLAVLQPIKLTGSPSPRRRTEVSVGSSAGYHTLSPRPIYTGLSSSTCDLVEVFHDENANCPKFSNHLENDDDNCVADDELSGCNEDEEDEERVKTRSLKKWASADDIIRSGSILDRSMIQAKKRRLRKSKARSQILTPTDLADTDETMSPDAHYPPGRGHYIKNKNAGKSKHSNPKLNHTDSGHDSDTLSPAPNSFSSAILDSLIAKHNAGVRKTSSAPKKSWETRLQSLQWLRKIRSRENLLNLNSPGRLV